MRSKQTERFDFERNRVSGEGQNGSTDISSW